MDLIVLYPFPNRTLFTRFFYTQIYHQSQSNSESEHHKTKKMRCDNVNNFLLQIDEEAGAERKYVMRKCWKLHLYISQLPCIFSINWILFFKRKLGILILKFNARASIYFDSFLGLSKVAMLHHQLLETSKLGQIMWHHVCSIKVWILYRKIKWKIVSWSAFSLL